MSEGSVPMTREYGLRVGNDIARVRYPGVLCGFVGGSISRGEATKHSDLDLVLVFESLPRARRESFLWNGLPVEAFLHDAETLKHFVFEVDRRAGRAPLANMVAEGLRLDGSEAHGRELQQWARDVIERGPPALTPEQLDGRRCVLTDLADDLRAPRARAERLATGSRLYELLGDFHLRRQGLWSATGKSLARNLQSHDAAFAQRFSDAFTLLFAKDVAEPVLGLVEDVLQPAGGWLFDGYAADAPATK